MRDPKRIDPLIELIKTVWKANPDLRLMQLLGNVLPLGDNYHVEDKNLEFNLKTHYKVII